MFPGRSAAHTVPKPSSLQRSTPFLQRSLSSESHSSPMPGKPSSTSLSQSSSLALHISLMFEGSSPRHSVPKPSAEHAT